MIRSIINKSTYYLIKKKIKTKFMRNTGWLLFENIFRMLISLIVTAYTARYLGTHDFGLLNYGMAYIAIFTIVCKLGIDNIIVNEIINNKGKTGEILGTTIILRLISSFLSILLIYIVVTILNPGNSVLVIITLLQSFSLLFIAFDVVGYWFQAYLQSKYAVIAKLVGLSIVSVWRLLLVHFKASVIYFALGTILEAAIIAVIILFLYFKKGGLKLGYSFGISRSLLSRSYHFLVAGLLITVYTQIGKIMLGQMAGESSVGIFTAAMTVATLWVFVPNALIESARPIILNAKSKNQEIYIKKYKQLYSSIIWMGICASIVITFLSKPLILILYGNDYMEATGILTIIIWSRIFALIGVARSIWLIAENNIKYQKYFVALGALVNVGLNFFLIPILGAIGSAIATLFAEIFSSTISLLIFKKTRPLFKTIAESVIFKGVML